MIKKLPAYMSEEEFKHLVKSTQKRHLKLAFILAFYSGLRISEVVNLKKEDFDLPGKRINIRGGKGGKDRVVPLPKGFPEAYLEFVPYPFGKRYLQKAFKKAITEAKITKTGLTFHSLRHSFAVMCLNRGMPLNHVQILLGHENIATTSIYTRVNPTDALKRYEDLWKD